MLLSSPRALAAAARSASPRASNNSVSGIPATSIGCGMERDGAHCSAMQRQQSFDDYQLRSFVWSPNW
jgi:hypothetical protein